ncbi:MAG: hypothetical protein JW837_07195 [Sedimentisphaerales bacterium]|nr:hypothetical protein [Sedimentisphaerales bacterium]
MTIQFFCPNCNDIIGFPDKHAGRRARCTNCGQLFIIPDESYKKPKKVELPEEKGEPLPGFYRAVFIDNWKLFFDSENVTSLVFVVAVVCFKFFTHGSCCCAFVTYYAVWGWLFGFYLNIIYETTFEIDKLPEIYLGSSITFLWYIIKPLFLFSITMAVVQLPCIIRFFMLKEQGLSLDDIRQLEFGLLHVLFIFGLFLFPMAILTASVGQTFTFFRPDYLLRPIFRAFLPYSVTVLLLVFAAFLEMRTAQFIRGAGLPATVGHLVLNLAVQVVAIFSMRSIGLFCRHYNCYLSW